MAIEIMICPLKIVMFHGYVKLAEGIDQFWEGSLGIHP